MEIQQSVLLKSHSWIDSAGKRNKGDVPAGAQTCLGLRDCVAQCDASVQHNEYLKKLPFIYTFFKSQDIAFL